MIEIVCKDGLQQEKKEGNISLPRNIRQMGSPGGRHKIYIEDYVYTYLNAVAEKKESCAAVFLGKSQMAKDIRYTFVNGALECGAGVFQWDKICLDDNFWKNLEREQKKYFPDREIVGWFLGKAGQAMELSPAVEAAHRKYFSGRDKVLMLLDVLEREEVFFIYDQGYLQKREGYYIYYEKNLPMQEYMIHKKEEEQRFEELTAFEEKDAEGSDAEVSELESRHIQPEKNAEGAGAEALKPESGNSLAGMKDSSEKNSYPESSKAKQEGTDIGDGDAKPRKLHRGIDDAKSEELQAGIGGVKSENSHAGLSDTKLESSHAGLSGAKSEGSHAEMSGTKSEGSHAEMSGAKSENSHTRMSDLNSEGPHAGVGDTEHRTSQLKLEEFRKLRRELRGDSGSQEKIFARSNLEEPKTQAEEALESYRNMMVTRHGRQVERQNRRFLYTASSFFLVAVCVLGITTINNYRKMQEVEDVLHVMRSKESTEKRSENPNGVVVESVESQVEPLEEGQQTGDGKEQGDAASDQAASQDGQTQGGTQDAKDGQTQGGAQDVQDGQTQGGAQDVQDGETQGASDQATKDVQAGSAEGSQSGETAGNAGNDQSGETSNDTQADETGSGETQASAQETSAEQPRYYTVQPGDTLASICINIYHSRDMMKKVCEANGIEDGDKIYAGQKLLLP